MTKALDGISGITKNIIFFHLKACERRDFEFCVFLRMACGPGGRGGTGTMRKLAGEGPACAPSNQLI